MGSVGSSRLPPAQALPASASLLCVTGHPLCAALRAAAAPAAGAAAVMAASSAACWCQRSARHPGWSLTGGKCSMSGSRFRS